MPLLVGNYGTFIGELFVNHDLNNTDYVGGMFRHHSSEGGIKNVALENRFFDTSLDLMYGSNQKTSYNVDLGYQNQIYNWYGLPANFDSTLINGINPQQTYGTISLGGNVTLNESILNKVLNTTIFRMLPGSPKIDFMQNRLWNSITWIVQ